MLASGQTSNRFMNVERMHPAILCDISDDVTVARLAWVQWVWGPRAPAVVSAAGPPGLYPAVRQSPAHICGMHT